ncbi:MAG TPA: hopanoid biosynthesis-associated protein HpnK [Casimicrobiaceae bacterium]|nr:hopanoid biosynthesis-associated protein HpnK [Casimicrobiaceae bacterium]
MKGLIVTADDFGLAPEVNAGVELAHTRGILTAASLMVSGAAAADAVARARRLPSLRVGLHLVLVDGAPTLPPERIPDLVDGEGRLRSDLGMAGIDVFLRRGARRQLAAEIEAQFAAYRATGLPLDHVNVHHHFQLHPTVCGHLLAIGERYGLRSVRVPREPRDVLARIETNARYGRSWLAGPWAAQLSRRIRRHGLSAPDRVFGLAWSGAMTEPRLAALLRYLPDGLTEIYCHPATADAFAGAAPGYRYADELAALTAPATRDLLRTTGARCGGFADFVQLRAS